MFPARSCLLALPSLLLVACAATPSAKTAASADAPAPASVASRPAPASTPAPSGGSLSDSKPMYGLDLQPLNGWTPVAQDEAQYAHWEKKDAFFGVHVHLLKDKLDTYEQFQEAAPMMSEVGTAITKVKASPRTTSKGWWVVVVSDEGKSEEFIYLQKHGDRRVLCSAQLKTETTGATEVTSDVALALCESLRPKP
jgi:hypothetical protein